MSYESWQRKYFRSPSHKERPDPKESWSSLRFSDKLGMLIGATMVAGVVLFVIGVLATLWVSSRQRAKANRDEITKAQGVETSWVWGFCTLDHTDDTSGNWELYGSVIIDKISSNQMQFHKWDGDALQLWTIDGSVGKLEGTHARATLEVVKRSGDELIWKYPPETPHGRAGYRRIVRTYPSYMTNWDSAHLFESNGWRLLMKDPEKEATWKLLVTFGDPKYGHEGKAKVSPDTLRLAYPYRRSENNADALCTYEWSRSKTQNFTQYRSRDGQYSERAALTCDIVKSIFENGPIFLTETEANGNQSSLMLLRY